MFLPEGRFFFYVKSTLRYSIVEIYLHGKNGNCLFVIGIVQFYCLNVFESIA